MVELKQVDIFGESGYHIAQTVLEGALPTFEHTHDFFEVFLVTEGRLNHIADGREQLLPQNALCLVRPETAHYYRRGDCALAGFINIAFSRRLFETVCDMLADYIPECKIDTLENRMVILPAVLSLAIQSKLSFLGGSQAEFFQVPPDGVMLGTLMDCFIFLHGRNTEEQTVPLWLAQACETLRDGRGFIQGLEYFITLSGKSHEHLSRTMKRCFRITPAAYINKLKLEEAVRLLRTTQLGILDIQLECGFANASYFNLLFKEEYGLTPSRFRALNRAVIDPKKIAPQKN